jgi:hypothetical protein
MEEKLKNELNEFDNWVVIFYKNGKGLSFDLKDEKSIALIPMLLGSKEELWDITKKMVWDIKKGK